jgi:SH3 domain protein
VKYLIIICTSIFLSINIASAKTRYVTDIFQVTLRSGTSTKNEIVRMLPSGTALEVLESDAKSGYTRVRTPSGKEGWILTRYLMDLPSARARLSRAETRLAEVEQQLNKIKEESKALSAQKNELGNERKNLNDQNMKLSKELARIKQISANAIQMSSENQRLKKQMAENDREIQFLQQENASLQDRSNRDWFMVGALVVVASMIFGILLTRIRWKKKSSWGDL